MWLLLLLSEVEGASCYSLSCPQPFQQYGGAYSFGDSIESHLIPPLSLNAGEGSFPGSAPLSDTVNSESCGGHQP